MKKKVKLLIECHGYLLVLRPLFKDKYTLVGGSVDKNEDVVAAAIREAYEEAGIELYRSDFTTYFSTIHQTKQKQIQFYCYLIRKDDLIFQLKEGHKFRSLSWVSIDDAIAQLKGAEKFSAAFFDTALFQKEAGKKRLNKAI